MAVLGKAKPLVLKTKKPLVLGTRKPQIFDNFFTVYDTIALNLIIT